MRQRHIVEVLRQTGKAESTRGRRLRGSHLGILRYQKRQQRDPPEQIEVPPLLTPVVEEFRHKVVLRSTERGTINQSINQSNNQSINIRLFDVKAISQLSKRN